MSITASFWLQTFKVDYLRTRTVFEDLNKAVKHIQGVSTIMGQTVKYTHRSNFCIAVWCLKKKVKEKKQEMV